MDPIKKPLGEQRVEPVIDANGYPSGRSTIPSIGAISIGRSMVIWAFIQNTHRPVQLLREQYPHQLVWEGHGR
jgi:hypothetical protein